MKDVLLDVLGFVLVNALVFVLVDELGFVLIDVLVVVLVQVLGYFLVKALVCVPGPCLNNIFKKKPALSEMSCVNLWKAAG